MHLNECGMIASKCWKEIPSHFQNADLDYYVIMPNHLHGIIIINQITSRDVAPVSTRLDASPDEAERNVSTNNFYSEISPRKGTLSVIIRSFKSACSKEIHGKTLNNFAWQPRFYDRIIRNEKELYNVRKYIELNPLKWEIEKFVPENIDLF